MSTHEAAEILVVIASYQRLNPTMENTASQRYNGRLKPNQRTTKLHLMTLGQRSPAGPMEGRAGGAYLLLVLLALVCRLLIGRVVGGGGGGGGGLLLEQAGGVDPPGGHAVVLGRHHGGACTQGDGGLEYSASSPASARRSASATATQWLL